MGTSSLHSDIPRRKRSISLPSFRKSSGERPVKTNVEETARVRKAAAWQWYIRGVGEVVAPTKPARPVAAANSGPAVHVDDKCGVDGAKLMNNDNNKQGQAQKAALPINQPPQLQRAASRFKTEATAARPAASALQGADPSPLYDEFELSGLRTQMADFVERLQQKQQKAGQEESLRGAAHAYGDNKPQPPAGISTAACGGAIPAAASTHAFGRPLNALHRFLRKVISGSALMKKTKNSPTMQITTPSPAVQERPFAPLDEEEDSAQYHCHHYIHHHHHHYHYGHSPEESAVITRRRRHSESSGMRPEIRRGPWEEVEEDYGGEEEDESPIQAYLTRRRRYSDSFAGHYKAVIRGNAEEESWGPGNMQQAGAPRLELLQRRYNSERFLSTSPNKIPVVDGRVSCKLGSKDEIDGERMQNISADIRSRRRHSADINVTEGASFNKKLSGEVCRGGKTAGSTIYKLGGGHAGSEGAALPMAEVPRRRHSETYSASFRRSEMNDHIRMSAVGGRTSSPAGSSDTMMYGPPASGRQYFEKPLQFPARPRTHAARDAALPPIYPQ